MTSMFTLPGCKVKRGGMSEEGRTEPMRMFCATESLYQPPQSFERVDIETRRIEMWYSDRVGQLRGTGEGKECLSDRVGRS